MGCSRVNAKERLRAYLEQRRELGESELVLDALDVDDVMRMLGALQSGAASTGSARAITHGEAEAPAKSADVRAEPTPIAPVSDPVAHDAAALSNDWHDVMQSLKADSTVKAGDHPPRKPAPSPNGPDAATPIRPAGRLSIEGIVVPLGLRVERPVVPSVIGVDWHSLDAVTAAIVACRGCVLVQSATRPVPGVGNPDADVMVIGEAPGEQEDLRGEPFVGPAGELLDKILASIRLDRTTVYIANVLKHRPPGNRTPLPDEVRACAPFLQRQIDLVQPKLIIALGNSAAHALLGTKLAMGKLRQQIHWYQGIPLVATYHPAALLRNDAWKRPTWEDVKLARRVLDATIRT